MAKLGRLDGKEFKSLDELKKALGSGFELEATNPSANRYVLNFRGGASEKPDTGAQL